MPSNRLNASCLNTKLKSIIMKQFKVCIISTSIAFSFYLGFFIFCCHRSTYTEQKSNNKSLQTVPIEDDKRDLINREIGKFRKTAEADEQKKEKEKDRKKREEEKKEKKAQAASVSRRRSRSRERSKVVNFCLIVNIREDLIYFLYLFRSVNGNAKGSVSVSVNENVNVSVKGKGSVNENENVNGNGKEI